MCNVCSQNLQPSQLEFPYIRRNAPSVSRSCSFFFSLALDSLDTVSPSMTDLETETLLLSISVPKALCQSRLAPDAGSAESIAFSHLTAVCRCIRTVILGMKRQAAIFAGD